MAPRWLSNGERLAVFRERQGTVNLSPPLWTRLVNSVLVPFPILASCSPRTLISPSLSPSTHRLHDKVYTALLFTSSPATICPSLHEAITGATRSPWNQPSSCFSLPCLSQTLSVCVCFFPFLSFCAYVSVALSHPHLLTGDSSYWNTFIPFSC